MPNRPEDDWTRPMPRPTGPHGPAREPQGETPTSSPSSDDTQWFPAHPHPFDEDRTQVIPQVPRRPRDDHGDPPPYLSEPRHSGGEGAATVPVPVSAPRQPRREEPPPPGQTGPPPRPPRRRRRGPLVWFRRIALLLLVAVLAYVGLMAWAVNGVWSSIEKVDSEPDAAGRPEDSAGRTFVLVGTDSREGLSKKERIRLKTGSTEGQRADTIMLLHLPDDGEPLLLSVPRDSYVEIPGEGRNKINAAYARGGPDLLVATVEQATGLRVDGYLEIGFGGFVQVVRAVDGVRMCLEKPVSDEMTKLDLPKGCQDLTGAEALKYVRMRYSDPTGDIGRVGRQRQFLAALTNKLATPANVVNPFRLKELGTGVGSAVKIGEDTSMTEVARMGLAMRAISSGEGQSLTVPVSDTNHQSAVGSTVLWDEKKSAALFKAMREGESINVEP